MQRKYQVTKILPQKGITIFSLNKLLEADEVLITNSLFGVLQVKKIKNISWKHQDSASLFNQSLESLNT